MASPLGARLRTGLIFLMTSVIVGIASVFAGPPDNGPGGVPPSGKFGIYFTNMVNGTGTTGVCPNGQVIIGFNTGTTSDYGKPICQTVSAYWTYSGTTLFYTGGNVALGKTTANYLLDVAGTGSFDNIRITRAPAGGRAGQTGSIAEYKGIGSAGGVYGLGYISQRNDGTYFSIPYTYTNVPVTRTSVTGSVTSFFTGGLVFLQGLAVDSVGNVYITYPSFNGVYKIDPTGTTNTTIITGGYPIAAAVDSSDNVYLAFAGSNQLAKLTSTGVLTVVATFAGSGTPLEVSVDEMDNVYSMSDYGVIYYTPKNTSTGIQISSPALARYNTGSYNYRMAAANGYLFLGTMGETTVYVYSIAEDVLYSHVTLPSYIDDITVNHVTGMVSIMGDDGNIYAVPIPKKMFLSKDPTGALNLSPSTIGGPLVGTTPIQTNGYNLNITGSGKVGIGTSLPNYTLDVNGTGSFGSLRVTAGASSGYVLTSDANGNTTWQAPAVSLPTAFTGQTLRYTGTGWIANSYIYNNGSNVGIGTYESSILTSGVRNTAVGGYLAGNTMAGSDNTALGGHSAGYIMSGIYNTAIGGRNAGYLMFGSYNNAMGGYQAGQNLSGSYNTAVGGYQPGFFMTGIYNTAVGGVGAGVSMAGTYNSAFGGQSAGYAMYGAYNSAFGGYYAGQYMTGLYNTAIGGYAPTINNPSVQYSVVIGSGAYSNQSGAIIIGGSGGRVGIANPNPQYSLDVTGTGEFDGLRLPTGAATGYVLTTDAFGNARWVTTGSLITETDPQVGTITTNYIPFWNGTSLVTGFAFNSSTGIGLGTTAPSATLDVVGLIKSNTYAVLPGGIAPAISGAPDSKIFSPSGQYLTSSTWGINYNEGTPDYIEFLNASSVTSRIALDDGSTHLALGGGAVGIANNAPTVKLDVTGSGRFTNDLTVLGTGTFAGLRLSTGAALNAILASDASGNARWVTTGSLITETDPQVGTITTNYIPKWNGSSLNNGTIFDTATGVGIGTIAPTAKLDVVGGIKNLASSGSDPVVIGSVAVGSGAGNPTPFDVDVQGSMAYVVNYYSGTMQAIDVTNPNQPVIVGTISTISAFPMDVEISAGYAYILHGNGDIKVFDISRPRNMTLVGSMSVGAGGTINSLEVIGKYLYSASNGSDQMKIFDISIPSNPVQLSVLTGFPSGIQGMDVSGNYAYVTSHNGSTLSIVDITNPASPTVVGSAGTQSHPNGVTVYGKYAYVAIYNFRMLQIFDVSNPTSPTLLTTYYWPTSINGATIKNYGRYIIMGSYSNSLHFIDVANPAAPVGYVGTVNAGGYGFDVSGDLIYGVDGTNTLSVIRMPGLEANGAYIYTLRAGEMNVDSSLNVQRSITANGISIGSKGLLSQGDIASTGTGTFYGLRLSTGAANNYILASDASGNARWVSTGSLFSANMGVCTTASITITNTVATYTCTGLPATTNIALACSSTSGAFSTPSATALYCRANGGANSMDCSTTLANTNALTYKCMWMQ